MIDYIIMRQNNSFQIFDNWIKCGVDCVSIIFPFWNLQVSKMEISFQKYNSTLYLYKRLNRKIN